MNQNDFDNATKNTGAIYLPYSGSDPHYELVGISVLTGNVNNRIQVNVSDQYGVWVRHSFGSEFERFPYGGEPVQFNLGTGSHFSVPNDPPDHITIDGLPSDEVRVGNANTIGFAHTDWVMTFRLSTTTPPPSGGLTEQDVIRIFNEQMAQATWKLVRQ